MAIYSLSQRVSNFTSAQACWEIRTSSALRPRIYEIGITLNTGTACTVGVGRPAAIGITPGGTASFQAEEPQDPASTLTGALSWATSPTAPTQYFRRVSLPATVGAGIVWTFPRGLVVPISSAIVIFNITTMVAADVWAVADE